MEPNSNYQFRRGRLDLENTWIRGCIDKLGDINLNNVRVDGLVISGQGKINAKKSHLVTVDAASSIFLANTFLRTVKSWHGKIKWENDSTEEVNADLIEAQKSIKIKNISCEKVYSHSGNIEIVSDPRKIFKTLIAGGNIDLCNAEVTKAVVAGGFLKAKKSDLNSVECKESLTLIDSRSLAVKITAVNGKATIDLENSTINGDVTVNNLTDQKVVSVTANNIRAKGNVSIIAVGSNESTSKVQLVIRGTGKVAGEVIFQNCKGDVNKDHLKSMVI